MWVMSVMVTVQQTLWLVAHVHSTSGQQITGLRQSWTFCGTDHILVSKCIRTFFYAHPFKRWSLRPFRALNDSLLTNGTWQKGQSVASERTATKSLCFLLSRIIHSGGSHLPRQEDAQVAHGEILKVDKCLILDDTLRGRC